jgi:hypothetical protein
MLSTVNICSKPDQRVNSNVMYSPLKVELQILSLIAEELPLVNNNTNLFWKPARRRPETFGIWGSDGCIEHKDSGNAVNGLSSCERLISLAPAAPSSTRCLTLDTRLENLGEGSLWDS